MEKEGLSPIKIERLTGLPQTPDDEELVKSSPAIRPDCFADYPGQDQVKENLKVYVDAAKKRKRCMDHVILHGAPGLGKTTLARILANELGVPFASTSGPAIDRPGDLAGLLVGLESGSLLFIDEIHRLSIKVEEVLYGALEDFAIDLTLRQGSAARTMRVDLQPFTLVGATTRLSLLSKPLIGRFGIQEKLEFYDEKALKQILLRTAAVLDLKIDDGGAAEIARRSRGTPRLANRLLKRVADFAETLSSAVIDRSMSDLGLTRQGIDAFGLDRLDRQILKVMRDLFKGGPVGIESLAVSLHEDPSTIEDVYEPYLVYMGYILRTPRGRMLSELGREYIEKAQRAKEGLT